MTITFHAKVFEGGLSGTTAAYSLPHFDAPLARCMRWYVTVRCTQSSGTNPGISINFQNSNTGMSSEFKNISTAGKVPIPGVAGNIPANAITIVEGSLRHTDANINVPGSAVRVEIALLGANDNANVEVWVTGRDDV